MNGLPKRIAPILGLSSLLCSGLFYSALGFSQPAQRSQLPLDDLQRFTSVVEHIQKYYVESTDDKTLFANAIRGMLTGLDPHSAYLDPNEFSDLRVNTTGKFGGLGIEVSLEDGFVKVISPIDDTPAKRAGIMPGDLIIRLDDTPVKGLTLRKAVEIMRGEKGSSIILTIIRQGENKPLNIKVIRDIIRVKSIKTQLLDDHFGYLRISQFQTRTGEDMIKALEKLNQSAKGPLKGLILDLRNNPGGILESSIKVSDAFLNHKTLKHDKLIVYTKGRLPGSEIKGLAKTGDMLKGAPMVVLINGGSASASEIVAGALQDHKRAIIMGASTFGKGSVQTVLPLKDKHGLKLTTALYYTPAGRSIQATGIEPDIKIDELKISQPSKEEISLLALKESQLNGHLQNGKEKTQSNPSVMDSSQDQKKDSPLATKDYQLNEALNLLKGLAILKSQS